MGLLSPYARTAIGALPDAGARGLALFAAAALLAASALSRAQEPTTRPAVPVADFFRTPMLARPTLSPNGRHLAGAVAAGSGRVRLAVLDLEPLGEPRAVAGFDDRDVDDIAWVNDRRLVFDTTDHQSGSSQFGSGLWAIDRDGSDQRQLIDLWYLSARPGMRTLPWTWRLHSVVADGSTDVLVQGVVLNNNEVVEISLARLDTKSGRSQNLSEGAPDHVFRWIVDRDGRPAAVTTLREGRFVAYLRSPSGSGWERWQDADAYAGNYAVPYAVAPDGQLLALGRRPDSTAALFAVDPTTRRLKPEPMVRLDGYDFRGSLVYDRDERRLIGVHYVTDASGTAWLHPTMKAVQEAVNAKLPGTVNRIECERCLQAPTMLVSSYSDRQPPVFYSYNRDTRALTRIAASRPWIDERVMARQDVHRFASRDGLSIPVLVTHPPDTGVGARPAVLLVHGGPWLRGTYWGWRPEAQFLASRGYVVLEPEFRGSQGYGFSHFRAGWKQWGFSMQDDLADTVEWAARQGWIDPARVCIAGGSYGGYATLMGLVRHHDLYRCGIAWAAPTDFELLYSISWSDVSSEFQGFGMPLLIGDRVKDADRLEAASPLRQAASVRRPLLLAYGASDRRVSVRHGTTFHDAVRRTNPDVEWVVYGDERHGWRTLETQVDFWSRVERFLAKHLPPATK
jgi:dipeptidyl aminopeptidase/acylaminoacyl peptidase